MNTVGEREIRTQQRVIAFIRDVLGYTYLGNWTESMDDNSNIISEYLAYWLRKQGHERHIITKGIHELKKSAAVGGSKKLYDANREVYGLLRYGVNVEPSTGKHRVTVKLIDWRNPFNNDFGIAEEVSLKGENPKRPDLVFYVNGIAIGVLELKRSTVSVSEGLRQNLTNQREDFIGWFFATVQLVMAGNETQGLHYGVIQTPEKHSLRWKETSAHPDAGDNSLLRELSQVCNKVRLLELLRNFIVFDANTKKICRHNQFFGVKAAQEHVKRREGGIIWHTQGSGKSLTMVWLAKSILETIPNSRILIITDRSELDEQIEKVFMGVNEDIKRTQSGAHLLRVLMNSMARLVCSLVQKFRRSGEIEDEDDDIVDFDVYVEDIEKHLPDGFQPKGEFFVFVDECHRTQSGKLHRAMKTLLPDSMLLGFTGTPLLKGDKQRSIETFGPYIHTYKYDEAVVDNVVLDLRYEARDIDQVLSSQESVDTWFESRTKGLTNVAKAQLRQRWSSMQNLLSSRERLGKIVADIVLDMADRDRLKSGRGNAMLIADSIFSACRFYQLFQATPLKGKCAIITSYRPSVDAIAREETGEGLTDRQTEYYVYREMLAEYFEEPPNTAMNKADRFEHEVKKLFIDAPAEMKLLIVVDKLLTGFDAPPATFLYIDKNMQDHGLFQAICRVNRIDGEDKEFGYIVDYKDLFRSLKQAVTDYTGDAFENFDAEDVQGLFKDRLQKGKERLEETREVVKALCEPVAPPHDSAAYIHYFCGQEAGNLEQLKENAPKRQNLYKFTAAFVRAYANLANDMTDVGYTEAQAQEIKREVNHYHNVSQEIKLASGDYVDLKAYEPDMRHLIDTYIRADKSETLSTLGDIPLVELIVENGVEALNLLPKAIRANEAAIAATIENNVRRLIVDKSDINPRYYEEISHLLDEIIRQRRQKAVNYRQYLFEIEGLSGRIAEHEKQYRYPSDINSNPLRAFFDNLEELPENRRAAAALAIDAAIRETKQDDWRSNRFKKIQVQNVITRVIRQEFSEFNLDVNALLKLAVNQSEY
ncbi:MAG: HsdR family type I site-specific deoxyribonuclease [Candidatus Poribacteria bacterium]|nr:HsdR family type I site-specific deoxyribonuclease [Candidatus Poribacteria bacterium]